MAMRRWRWGWGCPVLAAAGSPAEVSLCGSILVPTSSSCPSTQGCPYNRSTLWSPGDGPEAGDVLESAGSATEMPQFPWLSLCRDLVTLQDAPWWGARPARGALHLRTTVISPLFLCLSALILSFSHRNHTSLPGTLAACLWAIFAASFWRHSSQNRARRLQHSKADRKL